MGWEWHRGMGRERGRERGREKARDIGILFLLSLKQPFHNKRLQVAYTGKHGKRC